MGEYVMVPREWVETTVEAGAGEVMVLSDIATLAECLSQEHQGEPVAYLCKAEGAKWLQYGSKVGDPWKPGEVQVTPLYIHADPGEVERLRAELEAVKAEGIYWHNKVRLAEVKTENALNKLAERDALLRQLAADPGGSIRHYINSIDAALSASAEPSAPVERDVKATLRSLLEGVEVSIDVSTCDEDAGNRLFGTVAEVMDHPSGKHGVILLVHDQEPNFKPVERDERVECAICKDLGDQCMECEEAEFREWADRHFASADYRKTAAGVFIQDWMRHAFAAWQARAALECKP